MCAQKPVLCRKTVCLVRLIGLHFSVDFSKTFQCRFEIKGTTRSFANEILFLKASFVVFWREFGGVSAAGGQNLPINLNNGISVLWVVVKGERDSPVLSEKYIQ